MNLGFAGGGNSPSKTKAEKKTGTVRAFLEKELGWKLRQA
jgi:hypothetical protein